MLSVSSVSSFGSESSNGSGRSGPVREKEEEPLRRRSRSKSRRSRSSSSQVGKLCQIVSSLFLLGEDEDEEGEFSGLLVKSALSSASEGGTGVAMTGVMGGDVDGKGMSDVAEVREAAVAGRIVVAVSRRVAEMVRKGDSNESRAVIEQSENSIPAKGSLTIELDGAKPSKIPIEQYLFYIVRYLNAYHRHRTGANSAGIRALLTATIYIERLKTQNPSFVLNSFNIHRVFLTAILVSIKFAEDEPPSNLFMANVGGIDLAQMNYLESRFCSGIGFSLNISLKELTEAYECFDPTNTHSIVAPLGTTNRSVY